MSDFFSNPFVIGILSFIAGALFVYIKGLFKQHQLKQEIKHLKESIVTTMDEHRLNFEKIKTLEEQVNNQKITIQLLKEKPAQRDLRELRMYAEACIMMTKNAPGFAQAWQHCLEEIAKKEAEEEKGLAIFTKPIMSLLSIFKRPAAVISASNTDAPKTDLIAQEQSSREK